MRERKLTEIGRGKRKIGEHLELRSQGRIGEGRSTGKGVGKNLTGDDQGRMIAARRRGDTEQGGEHSGADGIVESTSACDNTTRTEKQSTT